MKILNLETHIYLSITDLLILMSISLVTIDKIIKYIESNKEKSVGHIASYLKESEEEIIQIIELLLQYKFINLADHYHITKVGRDYLKIKS